MMLLPVSLSINVLYMSDIILQALAEIVATGMIGLLYLADRLSLLQYVSVMHKLLSFSVAPLSSGRSLSQSFTQHGSPIGQSF